MNYSYMLNGRTVDGTLLKNHGFVQEGNCFSLRVELQNGLYTVIKIYNNKLDVDVFDEIFHKKYTAFSSGHSGSAIRTQVREIVEKILNGCCV